MRLPVALLLFSVYILISQPADAQSADTIFPELSRVTDLRLDYGSNNIVFIYKITPGDAFRFYLEGFDKVQTPWRENGFKEYTNIPAGRFVFHSEKKDEAGQIISLPEIRLHVLRPWYLTDMAVLSYIILISLVVWAAYEQINLNFAHRQFRLEQIINTRTEDLIIEKEKSEALLANVLPKNTASEIMAKGKATKIKYNFVTVLFSDIQGFTKIAEEMNPEVLIDELDKFFFYFDSVVEKFGIEKIKTIGDAYMCAGGIPEKNRTNPVEVILAALEMKAYMTRLKESSELQGMKYWDIRIGIHTGTVVAGVVGQKKLSYDIWGDTVNTASRMESSGEAGKINISGTTYEFVKDFFNCEYRGRMPVKYKGELEMYFVNGIVPELCNENGEPNRKFMTKMQMIKLLDIEEAVIRVFDEEASPNLYFHNSGLVKNVTNHVELLATSEKLPEEEVIILKLAVIFLFTGYIYDYEKPMEESVNLLTAMLPKYGFTQDEVSKAGEMIKNSFEKRYNSLPDMIIHDAMFDYLGRVDYTKLTEKLRREMTEYGKPQEGRSWIQQQKKLLKEHDFLTNAARILRNVSIEDQISALEKMIS
ncbi:MAG TPA: adenylate/guanylate cyclase domain-containing protein [Bacteroidales bacterium]|nr:adenylate/guanylate cyclase domain-containing protein [Bacteroidales bacterium]